MKFYYLFFSVLSACLLSACGGDISKNSSSPSSNSSLSAQASLSRQPSSSSSQSSSSVAAIVLPVSLGNKLFMHKIEHMTSTLPTGIHKETGALYIHYGSNSTFLGDNLMLTGSPITGTYAAAYDTDNANIKITSQTGASSPVVIVDTYMFLTATTGLWQQDYNGGVVILQGSFTLAEKVYPGYAPLELVGYKASLTFTKTTTNLAPGTYIDSGTAFHIYSTSSEFKTDLSNYGLPSGAGAYNYTRPALNIGVDTGFNVTFNAPYKIEYEFKTLTSGTFKESWNNGEILWEGDFVINKIQ